MAKAGNYRNLAPGGGAFAEASDWLRFRHLIFHLVASDLRSRYRRTYLGMAWAVLWPIGFSFIMSTVAVRIFNQPIQTYLMYVITGFVVWDFAGGAVTQGVGSIQAAEGYLRQTRLPHILFPIRTTAFLFVNYCFANIAIVLVILVFDREAISWTWTLWPVFSVLLFLFATPLVAISAVANLKYRDYGQAITLAMFLLWYMTPVIVLRHVYDSPGLATFTALNPFASLCDMFRDIMIYSRLPSLYDVGLVCAYTVGLWIVALGWLKFERRRLIHYF